MLLLLVLGMLEVLVVLVVLKELMVFVGGIFEKVKSPNFFWWKIIESKKNFFDINKDLKILKTKSKIQLYFRVVHSIIPLSVSLPPRMCLDVSAGFRPVLSPKERAGPHTGQV